MRTFTLRFYNDGLGEAREIEFEGSDPHLAFSLLAKERKQRRAELWEGQKKLGSVKRTGDEMWELE